MWTETQRKSSVRPRLARGGAFAAVVALAAGAASAAPFAAGDLAVFQAAASASNTTGSVVGVAPTGAAQTPTNVIAIPSTGASALRFSGSASSTSYLSHTDDRSLLTFAGGNTTDTVANINTANPRGVGTLDSAGNYVLRTTYTGGSGNQTRSATSLDNGTFYAGDQGGIYAGGTTTATATGNYRALKSFGGTMYSFTASASAVPVATFNGSSVAALPGLANGTTAAQDFYLVRSGSSGSAYDLLYVLSATSATAGTLDKYSLVAGSWAANGSYTTAFGGFGLAATTVDPTRATPGQALFVTTGNGATAANSLLRLTDTAGYNAAIAVTTANNVTLYTTPAGTLLKGVDFAPVGTAVPEPTALALLPVAGLLLARRRRPK